MTAKIFVTTYSIYNQGRQFESNKTGFWLDCANYDEGALMENFNAVDPGCANNHELMFTDFEGFPKALYSESGIDFDMIAEWEALSDEQQEIVELLVDNGIVSDFSEAISSADDCYIFEGSLGDYAYELSSGCDNIPDHLKNYIDWDAMGRDMCYDGNIIEIGYNRLLIANL